MYPQFYEKELTNLFKITFPQICMLFNSLRKQSNFLQIDSVNCFLYDQHDNGRNRKNIFLSKEGSSLDKRITNNEIYSRNHSFNVQKVFLKTNISLLLIRHVSMHIRGQKIMVSIKICVCS